MLISGFLAYTLTRFSCVRCGQFEHGWQTKCIDRCPTCGGWLLKEMECRGMTSTMLPFTTKPRVPQRPEQEKHDPAMGISPGVGEFKPRGNGRGSRGHSGPRGPRGRGRGAIRLVENVEVDEE